MTSKARLAVAWFVVVVVVCFVGWMGLRGYSAARERHTQPESYLATLTLAVTVVGVFAAGMGLGGSYLAWRVGGRAAEAMESARKLEQAVEEKAAKMAAYDAMVECMFGGWGSAGMLLADDLRLLEVAEELQRKCPDVADELVRLISGLRGTIAREAVLGAHAVQLFVSTDRSTTISSAQALAASGRREASKLLARRIEIEERKPQPDSELIGSLSYLHGAFAAR